MVILLSQRDHGHDAAQGEGEWNDDREGGAIVRTPNTVWGSGHTLVQTKLRLLVISGCHSLKPLPKDVFGSETQASHTDKCVSNQHGSLKNMTIVNYVNAAKAEFSKS